MYEKTRMYEIELRKDITIDGVKLEISAGKIGEGEWVLSVENEWGIRSVWVEFFATAQTALDAGMKAIELEGIEPFIDKEGFEYLFEDGSAEQVH